MTPSLFPDEILLTEETEAQQKPRTVKKPVETLAFFPVEEARLTFMARKVFNVLMHLAQSQGGQESVYRARLCEVIEGVDLGSNNTKHLKDTIISMVSTVVVWQSPTKNEGGNWTASALVSQVKLQREGNESWIEWSYSPIINKSIHDGKPFARISMDMQKRLKTFAGLALYEIALRYVNVPGGRTPSRPWGWWRPVLVGERENEPGSIYTQWKYFSRDILQKAVAEVNAYSDIRVEAIVTKRGRAINELQFKVTREKVLEAAPPTVTPLNIDFLARANKLKIPPEKVDSLLNRYGDEKLKEKLDILAREIERAEAGLREKISKPFAYLSTLLKAEGKSPEPGVSNTMISLINPNRPEQSAKAALIEQAKSKFETLNLEQKIALENSFEAAGFPNLSPIVRDYKTKWENKEPGFRVPKTGPVPSAFSIFLTRHFYGADLEKLESVDAQKP